MRDIEMDVINDLIAENKEITIGEYIDIRNEINDIINASLENDRKGLQGLRRIQ